MAVVPLPGAEFRGGIAPDGPALFSAQRKFAVPGGQEGLQGVAEGADVRKLRQVVLQVGHPAPDRGDPGGGKLASGDGQDPCKGVDIHIPHQGPVDHQAVPGHPFGVAGALPSLDQDVVPAAQLRRDAQRPKRPDHGMQVLRVLLFQVADPSGDGVVEILEVMVHRTASGDAAGEQDPPGLHIGNVHLGERILVQADNDRRPVLPKVENRLVRLQSVQAELVERHVVMRVRRGVGQVFHLSPGKPAGYRPPPRNRSHRRRSGPWHA